MTCAHNYMPMSMMDRRKKALTSLRDEGINPRLAFSLVTLSEGESGVIWASPRPNLMDPKGDIDCCSIIVGVETAYYPELIHSDTKFASWLSANGLAGATSNGSMANIGKFGNPAEQRLNKLAFERSVSMKGEGYRLFSVGPTQMFLKFSEACGFPKPNSTLWPAYLCAGDSPEDGRDLAGKFAANYLGYLTRKSDSPVGCLSDDVPYPSDSDSSCIAWMTHHAGNVATATQVAEGKYMGRRSWSAAWADTVLAGQSIGWSPG